MSSLIKCLNITNSDLTRKFANLACYTELANNFKVSRTNRPTQLIKCSATLAIKHTRNTLTLEERHKIDHRNYA
jgi:hypothetical protein